MRSVPPTVAGGSTVCTCAIVIVDPPATAGGTDLIQLWVCDLEFAWNAWGEKRFQITEWNLH